MVAPKALLVLCVAAAAAVTLSDGSAFAPTPAGPASTTPVRAVTGAASGPDAPLPSPSGPARSADPIVVSPAAPTPLSRAITSALPLDPLPPDLRVELPRLGIDLPLILGDLTRDTPGPAYPGATPERVALIHPASAPLASGGNTYVYAHARRGMFLSLWNAQTGDSVRIRSERSGVLLAYTVTRVVSSVPPSDTTWLEAGGPERLTLQTSTGPSPTDPRFIVIAMRDR